MRQRLFLAIFFSLVPLLFLHPINSGDFFHHLNTGRYIFENHALPRVDDSSFTAYGKPWVAHSWGAGLVFYAIYSLFGANGINILFAFLGFLTVFSLFLTIRHLKVKLLPAVFLTWLAAALISLRWPTRPEVLGPLFISALVYLLVAQREKLFILPIFFWFWGIIYGSSTFLGILIFGFWILSTKSFSRKVILIFSASFVASLLNGYGLRSFLYIFQIPEIAPHVGEWLPIFKTIDPRFVELSLYWQYPVILYFLFVAFYLICLVIALFKLRPFGKYFFIFAISFAVFTPMFSSRFINLAPLLAVPLIGFAIDAARTKLKLFVFTLSFFMVISAIFVAFNNLSFALGVEKPLFPEEPVNFIQKSGISGRIFSAQEVGGFLYWNLPDSRIFVDTRDDLYLHLGIFEELKTLKEGRVDIVSFLDRYGADIVIGDLLSGDIYKPLFYNDRWAIVSLSDGYFVAVREDLASLHKLPRLLALDPFRIPPVKEGEGEKAEREIENLLAVSPSIENQVRLIEIKLALGKAHQAARILAGINFPVKSGPKKVLLEISDLELAGKVYIAAGDCDRAYDVLSKAENASFGQLLFYPNVRLPSNVDRYLGEYYLLCKNDKPKAEEYFRRYFRQYNNPIEERRIRRLIDGI